MRVRIKVTYFKQTGKYYAEATCEVEITDEKHFFEVPDAFRKLVAEQGVAPGLVTTGAHFYRVLEPVDDIGYPFLLPVVPGLRAENM
jgi:hypothetical protein